MSHLVMGKFYIKGMDTAANRPYTEGNSRFSGVFMRNLLLCAALAVSAAAQPRVAIDELHIRAVQRDGHTVVILPIENQLNRATSGHLSLCWLDPKDTAYSAVEQQIAIPSGTPDVAIPLPLPENPFHGLAWLRLQYKLVHLSGFRAFAPINGIVALPQIADFPFRISIASVGLPRPGHPFTIRTRALHPVTEKPVPHVTFEAALDIDDKKMQPAKVTHEPTGFEAFTFNLPADLDENSADFKVRACLGEFCDSESSTIRINNQPAALVQMDKPIYQPGQTLHFRAVVLDGSRHAYPKQQVEWTVENQDDETLHHATLESSRFGIVHQDWTLPATAEPGNYTIIVRLSGEEDRLATHNIRISRYELPTFTVIVTPEHEAFLPDQPVRVNVASTYLFGKPVPGGKVQILPVGDKDEEPVAEGTADASGKWTALLDVDDDWDSFRREESRLFEDLHFAAFVTDLSTGRREQRRFDIRLTRHPIHIYVIHYPAQPLYISTCYASGKPAIANVEVNIGGKTTHLRTNRFGLARLAETPEDVDEIAVQAKDDAGLTGKWQQHVYGMERNIQVETSRSIYRAGEPIHLRFTSTEPHLDLMVDAVHDGNVLASRAVSLANGRAELDFPYDPRFAGKVVFVAWTDRELNRQWGYKTVVFPGTPDLQLAVTPEKKEYRPGDNAGIRLALRTEHGAPIAGAFGAAIVDQAVMERARTDSEFGRSTWFTCQNRGTSEPQFGGVTLHDIENLDLSKPIPEGLDLVAEVLLAGEDMPPNIDSAGSFRDGQLAAYSSKIQPQFAQLKQTLDTQFSRTLSYPKTEIEAYHLIRTDMHDPWGTLYRPKLHIAGSQNVLEFWSAGPDKLPNTPDDFIAGHFQWSWFRLHEKLIGDALAEQDYPANSQEFDAILRRNGILFEGLQDPWGNPMRVNFGTYGNNRAITITSAGPDGKFDTPDDVQVHTFIGRYFQRESQAFISALANAPKRPETVTQAAEILRAAGFDLDAYRDAWGNPYTIAVANGSRYRDRIINVKVYQSPDSVRQKSTPVTERLRTFSIRSAGPDGIPGNADDFDVASFVYTVAEDAGNTLPPSLAPSGTGEIAGTVTDPSGAAIPHATVTLILQHVIHETVTDGSGKYVFRNLATNVYAVTFASLGFQSGEVVEIPVRPHETTNVDFTLYVGSINETVTVEAAALPMNTSMAFMAAPPPPPSATSTPRLRDYFPETLYWAPDIESTPSGDAHLDVKLADNITTWKVAVFASTLDGRTAQTEAGLRAFQPFFIDLDPPPILTAGDRIDLPVTIRNYLDRAQKVSVELAGTSRQQLAVQPNASANATFPIVARTAQPDFRQRVTAISSQAKDAVEKPVRVHPDGQEVAQTAGDIVVSSTRLSITIPQSAIPGATTGELIVYPSLFSLLREGMAGILERPHGCAEQTTSGGYAHLVALRYARATGIKDPKFESKALQNIAIARDGLFAYAAPDGGFTFWGRGEPSLPVTAHVLTFLLAAKDFVEIDPDVLQKHADWLAKQQSNQPIIESVVARALAAARNAGLKVPDTALAALFHDLDKAPRHDPYLLANFALALMHAQRAQDAAGPIAELRQFAHTERDSLYWNLDTNTPYYGWGLAGRIESTGLAISALCRWREGVESEVRRGVLFLLRHRDRYGVWNSTQATLRAMQAIADAATILPGFAGQGGAIGIRVNGRAVRTEPLSDDRASIDVSSLLQPGENQVELTPTNGAGVTIVRLVTTHWMPWAQAIDRTSPELRLSVSYNHNECEVNAERVGFRGYGMMLAEIGLPPGAEVDRASLEAAGVDHYDVQPDRVVFYLWPKAGGTKFRFRFTPRFSMQAKSAPSILYDYYNPDARVTVPPADFRIP
jgi:hypothetical protein